MLCVVKLHNCVAVVMLYEKVDFLRMYNVFFCNDLQVLLLKHVKRLARLLQ